MATKKHHEHQLPFVISLLYCFVFHLSHKKWIQQNTLHSLTRLDDSGLQKQTQELHHFAVRCANCLVWLCLLALVTVPTLLGLLYIYMSASPEIIVPDTIPGTITTGDTQNDLSFGLALCGIGILLACVACLETTVFFDWLEKWCKTCNFTEGRSFLRTAVPIQWNGFFVSIIWCHSCNILLGIKNTSINLRPVFVKLAHHTKNPWKIHPPWALTFQGGCLQSPDHQIGFDQYRRSGRLYSTDAYAVHSVPRFGVKNWHGGLLGLNEIHWRMVTVIIWFDGKIAMSKFFGRVRGFEL